MNHIVEERKIIVKHFIHEFIRCCKRICPFFRMLYKYYYLTGSAFEGLQVLNPDEFDVNIVFTLPLSEFRKYKFKEVNCPPSFATFQLLQSMRQLIQQHDDDERFTMLARFFDHNNFLIGRNVLNWFQSLINRCLDSKKLHIPREILDTDETSSGPALTLKLRLYDQWISLDLVPVFTMNCEDFDLVQYRSWIDPYLMCKCFLVPKPLKDFRIFNLSEEQASRLWRIHFPKAEVKGILRGRHMLKPLIKLVKKLRDNMEWEFPSYFIKMAAFWIVNRHPDPCYFEREKFQGQCFIEILEYILNCLSNGQLRHIFYPEFNLLYNTHMDTIIPIRNRLEKIIDDLYYHPHLINDLFWQKLPPSCYADHRVFKTRCQ